MKAFIGVRNLPQRQGLSLSMSGRTLTPWSSLIGYIPLLYMIGS